MIDGERVFLWVEPKQPIMIHSETLEQSLLLVSRFTGETDQLTTWMRNCPIGRAFLFDASDPMDGCIVRILRGCEAGSDQPDEEAT